jgi:hypothetical protein
MKRTDYSATTLETVQTLTTYLLREPVKEAVRDALREEAAAVKEPSDSAADHRSVPSLETDSDRQDSGSSKLPLVVALVGIGAVGYILRRRRSSDDSTHSGDAQTAHTTAREETHDKDKPEAGARDDMDSSVTPVSDKS